MIGRHEQQEAAAARAAEFAAVSAETHRFVVRRVDLRQRDGGRKSPLRLPAFADKLSKIGKHGFRISSFQQCKPIVAKLHQMVQILLNFLFFGILQLLLQRRRRVALNAGVDKAERPIQRIAALRRHLGGTDRQFVLMELIEVKAAEGGMDLVLNSDVLVQQISFGVNSALEKIKLCDRTILAGIP